ncbi:hypothetical protein BDZ45DRAFT_794876 [Acephala macrosclerotiorum]|nr:hypothetical protein BDZ45DRAFT_794876 [Acephala macrosclerotiorum]
MPTSLPSRPQVPGQNREKHAEYPSPMLQRYLQAEATATERFSGASGAFPPETATKETRLKRAMKQINDFDEAWMDSQKVN